MNLIKGKGRNRLMTATMDRLMRITINGGRHSVQEFMKQFGVGIVQKFGHLKHRLVNGFCGKFAADIEGMTETKQEMDGES